MQDRRTDTIAAVATPQGRGGIGVVRISGPAVPDIVASLIRHPLQARHAHYENFRDADDSVIDSGIALFFPQPHSFTGEDVLELHAHGGPVILDLLLRRVLGLGARLARAGEFTERAYLNDKLDLAQAEAVADLIDSATEQAARSAQRSLQGEFSRRIHDLVEALIQLRLYVEAAIDFTDEEIDFLADERIASRIRELRGSLAEIRRSAQQGQLLRDGMCVVIAGPPNAGKSSLLNRLAGRDAAIVTDIPGTTRDVLKQHIQIDGMPLHVIDTAGLRETSDLVEQEGVRRARAEIAAADRVLLLIDDRDAASGKALRESLPQRIPVTKIYNKIDLTGRKAGYSESGAAVELALSVRTGEGFDSLLAHLKGCMGYDSSSASVFIARRRHLDALERAGAALDAAQNQLALGAGELAAEDLRVSQQALGEITGEFSSDDLLGRIFSSFCIGK